MTSAYVLVATALTLGTWASFVSPIELQAIMRGLGLRTSVAGGIVSVEMVATSVAALFVAAAIRPENASRLARISAGILLAANLCSVAVLSLPIFIAIRIVAGCAAGVLYGVSCFWTAQTKNGVRAFGIALLAASVLYAAGLSLWPQSVQAYGLVGLFGPMSVVSAVTLAIVALVRMPTGATAPAAAEQTGDTGASERSAWILGRIFLAAAFTNLGAAILWGLSEVIASARGFSPGTIAVILSTATFISIAGSLLASVVGSRYGVTRPLALGVLGMACGGVLLCYAMSPLVYGIALCVIQTTIFFALPFALGAGAAYDPTGRVAPLVGGVCFLAGAIGPAVGGVLFDVFSPLAVGWTAVGSCVAAAAAGYSLRRRL
jgi:predicted MFS family arabinose efflux permease